MQQQTKTNSKAVPYDQEPPRRYPRRIKWDMYKRCTRCHESAPDFYIGAGTGVNCEITALFLLAARADENIRIVHMRPEQRALLRRKMRLRDEVVQALRKIREDEGPQDEAKSQDG